jgi:hypothetical protein
MPSAERSELFFARVGWFGAPVCRDGMGRFVPSRETGATFCGGSLQAGCSAWQSAAASFLGLKRARQRERRRF